MKKIIAFDLDDTLAPSKSELPDAMAMVFRELLSKLPVCVISGGKFEQFELQLIQNLHADIEDLQNLHIMPTCGTRYMRINKQTGCWHKIYSEDIPVEHRKKIVRIISETVEKLGLAEKEVYGDTIEDRESQITFSALGQDIVARLGEEGVKRKADWDPDGRKRHKLRDELALLLPEFEIRVGGGTSIDITRPGIDKAYGMQKLKEELQIDNKDILFIGDRLEEGGNDYPVKEMGIDCIAVKDWQETRLVIETITKMY